MGKHFAAMENEELAAEMRERFNSFTDDLIRCGDMERMRIAYLNFYGSDPEGGQTEKTQARGAQDRLRKLKVNHFRAALKTRVELATSELPEYLPVPVSSDQRAIAQSQFGKALLRYYRKDKGLDAAVVETVLAGETMGWSWLDVPWDSTVGPAVGAELIGLDETSQPPGPVVREVYEGDLSYEPLLAPTVAMDLRRRDGLVPYVIIQKWRNKYDLAASYLNETGDQETADQIAGLTSERNVKDDLEFLYGIWGAEREDDDIEVLEFRHLPCPAVREGRCARLVGDSIFLKGATREKSPYQKDLGIYRYVAGRRLGGPRGYSSANDIGGLQTAIDTLSSIPYSNQRALGGNIIWSPEGSGLEYRKLTEGLGHITTKSPMHKPEVLDTLSTAKEIFDFRDTLIREESTLLSLDNLSMGREERDLSGAAMALLDTRTQRGVSSVAEGAGGLLMQGCNQTLRLLQMHATTSRKVPLIVGKAKKSMLREFSAKDLDLLDSTQAEEVSALMRVPSGRLEVANQLLAAKGAGGQPLINEQQYMAVLETGQLEPLTEGPMAQLMNIRQENERLSAGEVLDSPPPPVDPLTGMPLPLPPGAPPPVTTALIIDHHPMHISEHVTVLASPEARADPAIAAATLNHIQAHIRLWREADPALLASLGIPPPPAPVMTAMPGQEGGTAPPADGEATGTEPPAPAESTSSIPVVPGGPAMPTNPSTGEEYSPTGAINPA